MVYYLPVVTMLAGASNLYAPPCPSASDVESATDSKERRAGVVAREVTSALTKEFMAKFDALETKLAMILTYPDKVIPSVAKQSSSGMFGKSVMKHRLERTVWRHCSLLRLSPCCAHL